MDDAALSLPDFLLITLFTAAAAAAAASTRNTGGREERAPDSARRQCSGGDHQLPKPQPNGFSRGTIHYLTVVGCSGCWESLDLDLVIW